MNVFPPYKKVWEGSDTVDADLEDLHVGMQSRDTYTSEACLGMRDPKSILAFTREASTSKYKLSYYK